MKYTDWLSKLRAYFGAVDQRYQPESKTIKHRQHRHSTRSSVAMRVASALCYILVMTTTGSASDKCHGAGMTEGFEAVKQFVMEWEMEFVGLLINVPPTKLATFGRLVQESQSSGIVNDDTKTGVTVLGMEDMRIKAYLFQNSARIAS